ncbi:MAG: PKD domain-containing protein [Bacteroidota bacterium]
MKKIFLSLMAIVTMAALTMSCKKDGGGTTLPAPTASFTKVIAGLQVTLTNTSTNAKSYSWDFGDGTTASTAASPAHTYAAGGTYTITLSVVGTNNATVTSSQSVTLTAPAVAGPNLILGGDMSDATKWTSFPIYAGVTAAITGGVAKWTGGEATPGAGGGHYGIYQAVNVEAGKTYQLDMHVKGTGINNVWFEVYVGTAVPTAGVDYVAGGKRLTLNTWDCASTNKTFDAQLSTISCTTGAWNNITFPSSGTVYIMIRSGGDDFTLTGGTGVTVDNVDFHSL